MSKLIKHPFMIITLLTLAIGGCSSGNKAPEVTGGNTENTAGQAPANPSSSGGVNNKIEQAGTVSYKVYFQGDAKVASRKGIVLFGSGNDENDPSTGSLDDALENNVANELAKLGYVSAIVAYRDEPPLNPKDNGESWNSNSAMLATDMSNVADAIIATYGGSRNQVLTGGVSYASYALLTNIAEANTPLADTRGVLATCGATGDFEAKNFKIPIFSLNCSGNQEGDFNGQPLIDKITNPKIKADSGFFTDASCNTHCGGTTSDWTAKLLERVKLWLP